MKVSLKEKVSFLCGNLGTDLIQNYIRSFFLIFMTNVLGISALAGSTILLISIFWDAINDPLMGFIADRGKQTKYGKYRPFILKSIVPMCVACVLMFMNTTGLSVAARVAIAGIFYICYGMVFTYGQVPYGALSNVMTEDSQERAVLGTFRDYGANLGGTIMNSVGAGLIIAFSAGTEADAHGYLGAAIIVAIVSGVLVFISFIGTREHVVCETQPVNIKDSFKCLIGSKPALLIAGMFLFTTFGTSFRSAITAYYTTYYLGDFSLIGSILGIMFAVPLVGLFFIPPLTKKLGRKTMFIIGNLWLVIGGICYLIAGKNVIMIYVGSFFCGLCVSFVNSVVWGAMPDAAEYGEWKTGIRAPGFIYAIALFALKCGQAIANYGAGIVLTIAKFDSAAEVQADSVGQSIYWSYGLFAIIPAIIAIIIICFYKLDNKTIQKIHTELDQKRTIEN